MSEPQIQVSFWVPAVDIAAFDAVAEQRRMSRSALLRECILTAATEDQK